MNQESIKVPLRNRFGSVAYYAIVSPEDADRVLAYKWHLNQGYAFSWSASDNDKRINMARFILGCQKPLVPDHINFNRLDNRRENLRPVSPSENVKRKQHKKFRNLESTALRVSVELRNKLKEKATAKDLFLQDFAEHIIRIGLSHEADIIPSK